MYVRRALVMEVHKARTAGHFVMVIIYLVTLGVRVVVFCRHFRSALTALASFTPTRGLAFGE